MLWVISQQLHQAPFQQNGKSSRSYLCFHRSTFNRLQLFRSRVSHLFTTKFRDLEAEKVSTFVEWINDGLSTDELFSTAEAVAGFEAMEGADEVMMSDDLIYKV